MNQTLRLPGTQTLRLLDPLARSRADPTLDAWPLGLRRAPEPAVDPGAARVLPTCTQTPKRRIQNVESPILEPNTPLV